MIENNGGVAAKAYARLCAKRETYLNRARDNAALTVPYLMTPAGFSGTSELAQPRQSIGSRGLRHLASKLLLTCFPTTAPFFIYKVDDIVLQQMTGVEDARGMVEEALDERARAVMTEMASVSFRPLTFEAFRQLLIAGNYLLYIPRDGDPRGFRLDSYVVLRDPEGNLLEIVIEEEIARAALTDNLLEAIKQQEQDDPKTSEESDKPLKVYTHIKRKGDRVSSYQEIEGFLVPDSDGDFPLDLCPWLPLRLTKLEDEDYGRSYVEEFFGDLQSLEVLSKALVEGTAALAKVVFLVSPNATTNVKKLSAAETGDFVQGEANGIVPLQVEKRADFSVVQQFIDSLVNRLSFAFLLNTAIQRNGDRVTAEEMRIMASEIEDGLGGMYSLLADEYQLPVVKLFEARMEHRRNIKALPKGVVSPSIVTGLDALGRGHDLQNLTGFITDLAQTLGPEAVQQYVDVPEYIKRRGASAGIDMKGLIKSEEQIAQEQQQQQMMMMIQQLGPNGVNQIGQLMKSQMDAGAAQDQAQEGENSNG
nr:portal protein [uncultured Cohaesibacter sp.]